jgi:hypothetical protein
MTFPTQHPKPRLNPMKVLPVHFLIGIDELITSLEIVHSARFKLLI